MRKLIMTAIVIVSLCLGSTASAAEVVITTGQQGLTYNVVYGVNLVSALNEYGYGSIVTPSKGSLDNLGKAASGTAQIGLTQAGAFQFWCSWYSNETQKVDIIGKLVDECVFIVVKKGGKISGEGGLKADVKITVGEPTSGSYTSWQYSQGLEKDCVKVETYVKSGMRSLGKVTTGEYDVFFWVSVPDRSNKLLEAVNQEGSGLTTTDTNGWHLDDKLPNGKPVYELKRVVTESGWLSDPKIKVPCTRTLVVANTDVGDEVLETAPTVLLKNLSRVFGTNGK